MRTPMFCTLPVIAALVVSASFVVAATALASPPPSSADAAPLRVVGDLDLERYAGRWFEIARFPNRFQRDCAGEVTATYSLRDDGRIAVINRCRQQDGSMKEAEGVARRVEGRPPSVLKVRFAPAFLSFLPMVWGDYQVIALGDEYDYAVVGTPDRKYLWILARQASMDPARYEDAVAAAKAQGFDVGRLVATAQASGRPD